MKPRGLYEIRFPREEQGLVIIRRDIRQRVESQFYFIEM